MSSEECNDQSKSAGWESALILAKDKLSEGKVFVAKMKAAIKHCEEMIASGEPWPGSKNAATRN